MSADKPLMLHGTAVLLRGRAHPPAAVFLRGLSGSGKSDLAFRLVEKGATLVCDDQVVFQRKQDKVMVSGVAAINGLLEVRGVGLLRYPAEPHPVPLRLIVNLVKRDDVPRLPDWKNEDILGVNIAVLALHAFDVSTVLKVQKAMEILHQPEKMV